MKQIYLDYAATTPVDPRVLKVMLPYFIERFGNPSSIHSYGQQAESALETARELIAEYLNCEPREIIFTSCGSESDNLALRGTAFAERKRRLANHLLVSPVEHPAVIRTAKQLAELHGFELELIPVDPFGRVDPSDVEKLIRPTTALVSVIYANNEIGTINPIAEIGAVCRNRGVPFHTDAVQAVAYLSTDVKELSVDFLSLGAHKFYGPKGVGALYVRDGAGLQIIPQQSGGGQEFGYRSGTHNTPLIIGMAEALRLTHEERSARINHVLPLREFLIAQILKLIPEAQLTGHPTHRLPNHASFAFRGVNGNDLLILLDMAGFACSSGSACKTGNPEPSEVLTAIGLDRDWASGSLRITLGINSNMEEMHSIASILPGLIKISRSDEK